MKEKKMFSEDAVVECDKDDSGETGNGNDFEIDLEAFEKKGSTQCLCPKCGKEHKLKIFWTGRGTPRIYCHRCRELVTTICDCAIYESQPDNFRVAKSGVSYAEY
jgi:hypothetical protein